MVLALYPHGSEDAMRPGRGSLSVPDGFENRRRPRRTRGFCTQSGVLVGRKWESSVSMTPLTPGLSVWTPRSGARLCSAARGHWLGSLPVMRSVLLNILKEK